MQYLPRVFLCALSIYSSASLTASDVRAQAEADSTSNTKPDMRLFIGPEDCPGAPAFADPYALQVGGTWYITSTYSVNQPMYMFETSDWADKKRHLLEIDLNSDYLQSYFEDEALKLHAIWGFVPYKHTDNSWHAYGTIHVGNYKTFVCHFRPLTDAWPVTSWRLDKVLVGNPSGTVAYESKVYGDATGSYLVYVETRADGDNHIMVQKLLAPDEIDISFQAYPILSPEGLNSEYRNGSNGMQICEGTNISHVVLPSGSKYVMFYSVGDFAIANYKLGVAYSDVLIPPAGRQYTKPKVYDADNIWENPTAKNEVVYLFQTQKENWYNNCSEIVNGPGLGNLIHYRGDYYIVFHARRRSDAGSGRGRWVWISPATVDFDAASMNQWIVPNL